MDWFVGCSGYHYPEWKRIFYPEDIPQRKWFEFYSRHFNTLELNVTYYRFPRIDSLRRWAENSPADFNFTVKAPRHITHFRKFVEAQRLLNDFYELTVGGLGKKLGCVLFQFPADYYYTPERLSRIAGMLDGSLRNVLEFRHESWWAQDVYDHLRASNISFCGMSHPSLPERVVCTTDTAYFRFHGVPHLYNSPYDTKKIDEIARALASSGAKRAFVYFNNTANGHAIVNAKELQQLVQ
jgi:uncharacterized protein YecE (DUF72 family)